ncbi:MAG: ABC transporter permease, partial [Clostridia bacterium]|nr:ABC transporter permease [Clostridia bacterium]
VDYTTMLAGFMSDGGKRTAEQVPEDETVTSRDMIENLLNNVLDSLGVNDLKSFKTYLDGKIDYSIISAVKYTYDLNPRLFVRSSGKYRQVSPVKLPPAETILPGGGSMFELYYKNFNSYMNQQGIFSEMMENSKLLDQQYDVLRGAWPSSADEMVLVVDQYNQLSDLNLYMLGLMNDSDIAYVFQKLMMQFMGQLEGLTEEQIDEKVSSALAANGYEQTHRSKKSYSFDELMALEYGVLLPYQTFKKTGVTKTVEGKPFPLWKKCTDEDLIDIVADNDLYVTSGGTKLKISGIVRLKETATSGSLTTSLCYTKALTDLLIDKTQRSELALQQLGQAGQTDYWDVFGDPDEWAPITKTDFDKNTSLIGVIDKATPTSISIYPISFEAKDKVVEMIESYNRDVEAHNAEIDKNGGNPLDKKTEIKFNDYIGLMMSSITDIINSVTYILIAFVSISLIVSSIMISVITHISVLERTKEIGVLRSIGASKRDISRVFNAETAIIGFTSGILGIAITILLNIPISIIIANLAGLKNIASLPIWGGFALVGISTLLTIVAGLIPAHKASKQDPVVALRSE